MPARVRDPIEAHLARFGGTNVDITLQGSPQSHGHDASDITGTFANIVVSDSIASSTWNDFPINLSGGASASPGFALDAPNGVVQAETLFAKNITITGVVSGGSFSGGDIESTAWDGTSPADLSGGADGGATAGYYLDDSAGAIQAMQLYADDITVTGTVSGGTISGAKFEGGDVRSTAWDGANPANLATPDGGATAGYYLDDSAGAAQFQTLYASNITISGTVSGGTFTGGDIYASNWNGTIPANLATPDAGATAGYYLDASAGAAQFQKVFAEGGQIGSLDVVNLLTMTGSGDIKANWNGASPANLASVDVNASSGFYLDGSRGAAQFTELFVGNGQGAGSIDYIALQRTAGAGNPPEIRWHFNGAATGYISADSTQFTIDSVGDLFLRPSAGTGSVILTGASFDPNSDNNRDLGTAAKSWRDLYVFNIKDESGNLVLDTSVTGAVWGADNDGAGSGLDADKLDGLHAAAFGEVASANTWTGSQTFQRTGLTAKFYRETTGATNDIIQGNSNIGGTDTNRMAVDANGDLRNTNGAYLTLSDPTAKSWMKKVEGDREMRLYQKARKVNSWEYEIKGEAGTLLGFNTDEMRGSRMRKKASDGRWYAKQSIIHNLGFVGMKVNADRIDALEAEVAALRKLVAP